MSAPESYPTRLLSGEVQRMQQYLEMGSTDVALESDADVQRCLHLLTGISNVSSEDGCTGDTPSNVQHRFRSRASWVRARLELSFSHTINRCRWMLPSSY